MHMAALLLLAAAALLGSGPSFAQTVAGLPIVTVEGSRYSLTLELLALITVLTLIPSLVLMMTSFVRIIIVMSILRQALGTASTPLIRFLWVWRSF